MKKAEQLAINARVAKEAANFMNESNLYGVQFISRLRSCSAEVLASDSYYALRSYSTIVALIDSEGTCYDFLRDVYGYTATSAQHINKFAHDYGTGKILSWKAV